MDIDGTLTDGKIYMSENGEMTEAFNIIDGFFIPYMFPEMGVSELYQEVGRLVCPA